MGEETMKPADLVEKLLSEDDETLQQIVREVEKYLGDVITPETDDATAREECWTLCIDKANDLVGRGPKAIQIAKTACAQLGYPPKGYRSKSSTNQPVWPPKTYSAADLAPVRDEPERAVKPTGVIHKAYRPDFLK